MTDDRHRPRLDRRRFLRGVAAVGAASGVVPHAGAGTRAAPGPAVGPPSAAVQAAERAPAEGYSAQETARYFVRDPASDRMVDVLRALGIDYAATNPAASFRGLHESIVNYGGNTRPELLTCLHEESAVAIGHGYAKAAGKPLAVLVDGVVGLQHAAMAVYNAWCDRVPVYIVAGNYVDAADRRPPVEWSHAAQDPAAMLRDFIKWDDQPASMPHFVESALRAHRIATLPPMGPVVLVADAALQERESDAPIMLPRLAPAIAPQGDAGAVAEAARLLVAAESPVIVADRVARTPAGMAALVELAETLQAPVIDRLGRMNFPNDHFLNHTWRSRAVVPEADLILGLEIYDFWGVINRLNDVPDRTQTHRLRAGARLVSLGMTDTGVKSNYQDFQRFLGVDLAIAGDAEATLPALIEAVRRLEPARRRGPRAARGRALADAHREMRAAARDAARYAWDATPISTARLCMEIWRLIERRDWTLASEPFFQGYWPQRLWVMNRHHQYLGGSGGYGVGYAAPGALGAALANRGSGRVCVNLQPDGDLMYAPGVLWTAAHHRIPLLSVVHNNGAYHQEVMQVQRMAARRQRGADGASAIGTRIDTPPIDFAALARSMGVWSAGPITAPADLGPALERALEIVDRGEPALLDVVCEPR